MPTPPAAASTRKPRSPSCSSGWSGTESAADRLTPADIDELLSLQGTGGPLTSFGVEHFVTLIERKRGLIDKVQAVAGTEYIDLLEQIVNLLYEKVQPYAERR